MTEPTRPLDPPGSSGSPWSAGPPPGYPVAPPVVPGPIEPVHPLAYEPPPAFQAPPYGAGPEPVGADGPWSWSGPWNDLRHDPALGYLGPVAPPAPPSRPGSVFWPKTIAWMGIDPQRSRWGIPDIVLGIVAFFVGGILLGGAVFVIGSAATGSGVKAFVDEYAGIVNIISLFGQWGAVVGFLMLIARLKGTGSLRREFGFAFSWWDPLIGAGAAVVTLMVSGMVQAIVAYLTGTPPASNSDAIFGDVIDSKPLLVATVLLASIGAPLVEELLFRGLVLRALEKRLGAVAAVAGSSLLFGALHLFGSPVSPVALLAGISVYGLIFALLTRWWCRLGPAVFTHIWVNTLASAFVLIPVLLK